MSSNWISTRLGKKQLFAQHSTARPTEISLLDVVRRVSLLYNLLKSEFFKSVFFVFQSKM